MSSGQLDPEPSRLEIKIIVDENKISSGKLVFAEQTFERRTRDVHEVEGSGKLDYLGPKPPSPSISCAASGKPNGPSSCGPFENPHAGVVAGTGVGRTGVAQPHD